MQNDELLEVDELNLLLVKVTTVLNLHDKANWQEAEQMNLEEDLMNHEEADLSNHEEADQLIHEEADLSNHEVELKVCSE
jgi:hypothetical protein